MHLMCLNEVWDQIDNHLVTIAISNISLHVELINSDRHQINWKLIS